MYIKARSGSRIKGFALCDIRDLPADVRVDFVNHAIEVSDASGFGLKFGVKGRITRNMEELSQIVKSAIEDDHHAGE